MVDSPNGEHALIRNIFTSHTRNFFARPLFVGHEGGARSCECGTSAALKSSNYGVVLVALGGEAGREVRKMTCKNWGHFPGPNLPSPLECCAWTTRGEGRAKGCAHLPKQAEGARFSGE